MYFLLFSWNERYAGDNRRLRPRAVVYNLLMAEYQSPFFTAWRVAVVCWCSPVRVVSVVSFVCCDLVRCDVEVVRWIVKIKNQMYINFDSTRVTCTNRTAQVWLTVALLLVLPVERVIAVSLFLFFLLVEFSVEVTFVLDWDVEEGCFKLNYIMLD